MTQRTSRRGMSVPEWTAVLAVLAVGVIWWGSSMGVALQNDATNTATNVADPSTLVLRFSGQPYANSSSNNGGGGTYSGGYDGNGNGEGTSPGNPGYKGGKWGKGGKKGG